MNEKPTPETDEAQFGTGQISVEFARRMERERDEARAQRAAERALADRLADELESFIELRADLPAVKKAIAAWKEARNDNDRN